MTLSQHTTTVLTREEWAGISSRKWDYIPRAERMAIHRERLARMRAERRERQQAEDAATERYERLFKEHYG